MKGDIIMKNRLEFSGYINKPEIKFPDSQIGKLNKESIQALEPVEVHWDLVDAIMEDMFQRDWDFDSTIYLDDCGFYDELYDNNEGFTGQDFVDFLKKQPEFSKSNKDNIRKALDNLDLTEFCDRMIEGYDYRVNIDIDLLPFYDKFLLEHRKSQDIESEIDDR